MTPFRFVVRPIIESSELLLFLFLQKHRSNTLTCPIRALYNPGLWSSHFIADRIAAGESNGGRAVFHEPAAHKGCKDRCPSPPLEVFGGRLPLDAGRHGLDSTQLPDSRTQ